MIDDYMNRWGLEPDGQPITTNSGHLVPVHYNGMPAILKIATHEEEKPAAALMAWWRGEGAARVLAHDGSALLLERAEGGQMLAEMARNGRDDEACRIICAVALKLHAPRPEQPPALTGLPRWFQALGICAAAHGGIFAIAAVTARNLLASPQDIRVLHGDIHHSNILDFGQRGWLAIDPKGLVGERGFDFANLFCNPNFETAVTPERFSRRVDVVAAAAALDHGRLLQWIVAWAGLSASWHIEDGTKADTALAVARMAIAKL